MLTAITCAILLAAIGVNVRTMLTPDKKPREKIYVAGRPNLEMGTARSLERVPRSVAGGLEDRTAE